MIKPIKTMTGHYPPTGMLCPRCDWLYKQLTEDSFCLRCWDTHVNVAVSFIEVIPLGERIEQ